MVLVATVLALATLLAWSDIAHAETESSPEAALSPQGAVGDTFDQDGLTYEVIAPSADLATTEDTASCLGFTDDGDKSQTVSIPATASHDGVAYKVTQVDEGAFFGKSTLYYLDLSSASNLIRIDDNAFASCGLRHDASNPLRFPSSLVTISGSAGEGAFEHDSLLKKIDFSFASSLATIGDFAFAFCGLDYPYDATTSSKGNPLVFPSSLKTLGDYAFTSDATLSYIDLLGATSLTTIGEDVFSSCSLASKAKAMLAIPSSVTQIGSNAFKGNPSIVFLDLSHAWSLEEIDDFAFGDCNFLSLYDSGGWLLTIPPNVKTIGQKAFGGTYDSPLYFSTVTGVVFMSTYPPPDIDKEAFLSTGSDSTHEYEPVDVKDVIVSASSFENYATFMPNAGLSSFSPVVTKFSLVGDKPAISWDQGTSKPQSYSFSLTDAQGQETKAQGTIAIPVSVRPYGSSTVAASAVGFFEKGSSTATVTIPAQAMASLGYGSYTVSAEGVAMEMPHGNMASIDLGSINVQGTRHPTVSGAVNVSRDVFSTDDLAVTATLAGAAEEKTIFTCEISGLGAAVPPSRKVCSQNGDISFLFSSSSLSSLVAGRYAITISSKASDHNAAIAATRVGTLTVSKATPSFSPVSMAFSRKWHDTKGFFEEVTITGAYPEAIGVVGRIMSGNKVVASGTTFAKEDGFADVPFSGAVLWNLEVGHYVIAVESPGSNNNEGIDRTNVGTLEVEKYKPAITGDQSPSRTVGASDDLPVSFALAGATPESIPVSCEVGGVSLQATVTGDGEVQMTFPGAELAKLAVGTYDIMASSAESAHNQAVAATRVGTLTVAAYAPGLARATGVAERQYRAVGVESNLSIACDVTGAYGTELSLHCELRGPSQTKPFIDINDQGDGRVEFEFAKSNMKNLPTGTYQIVASAKATEHNAAIAPEVICTLVVHETNPNVTADEVKAERTYGTDEGLSIDALLTGIYSGEPMSLVCGLVPTSGTPSVTTSTSAETGDVTLSFTADQMKTLAPGTYEVHVAAAATTHNNAIADKKLGTVSVVKGTPSFDTQVDETRIYGSSDPLTVTGSLIRVAGGEKVDLACTVASITDPSTPLVTTTASSGNNTQLPIALPGEKMAALEPGVYQVGISAEGTDHNEAIPSTVVGVVEVTRHSPKVTASNDIAVTYLSGDALTVSARTEGAYAGADQLPYVCSVFSSSGLLVMDSAVRQDGDGDLSFSLPVASTAMLAPGAYKLVVSSPGSAHNDPVADVDAGTLTVDPYQASVSGNTSDRRKVRTDEDFSVPVSVAMAPEELTLSYSLVAADASVASTGSVVVSEAGSTSLAFPAADMEKLPAGSYTVMAGASAGQRNAAIAPTKVASLVVSKFSPLVVGSLSLSGTVGSASSCSGALGLRSIWLGSGVTATLAVGTTGVVVSSDVASDGSVTFGLGDDANSLANGSYRLALSIPGSDENEAVNALDVGTLEVSDPSFGFVGSSRHVIGSGEAITFRVEIDKGYETSVTVDGVELGEGQAAVTSGSTIVTLAPSYLDTLPVGRHALAVGYSVPFTAEATFEVVAGGGGGGGGGAPTPGLPPGAGSSATDAVAVADTADHATGTLPLAFAAAGAAAVVAGRARRRARDGRTRGADDE